MPETTDDQMDARLHAAGARWRAATPAAAGPLDAGDEADITPERPRPRRTRTWIAAASGAALVAAAVVIGVAVTRGDNGSPQPAGPPELAGTSWVLADPTAAPLTFTGNGQLSGGDGCNSFSGPVGVTADTLHLGNLARTEMACANTQPTADLIDRVFVGDVGWAITGGGLTLTKAGVGSLTYTVKAPATSSTDPAKLVGVTWGLSGVEHDSGNSASGSGSSDSAAITMTFDGRDGYRVEQRCGSTTGQVVLASGSATFSKRVEHPHSCPPSDGSSGSDMSTTMAQVLAGETTWSITDGTLTITKGSTKLTFTDHPSADQAAPSSDANPPATALLGTSWLLADINSPTFHQTLDTRKTKLKLTIDAKGVVRIDDGVNFHSPENEKPIGISADTMNLGQLTSSAAGCAPVGAGAQNCTRSNVVAEFFAGTIGWAMHSDHLTLTKGATTLVYVRG